MNPDTGEFHELNGDGKLKDAPPKPPAELIGRRPPKEWPIFKVGERVDECGIDIVEVTGKDLIIEHFPQITNSDGSQGVRLDTIQLGDIINVRGRDFKARKKLARKIWLRPVMGRLVRQL